MRMLLDNGKSFLGEIDLMDLIYFSLAIGNFCCWANFWGLVYLVLDFRSINLFMAIKMRKLLEL